jgi:altronate hydrolase
MLRRTLAGIAQHPNVGGCLLVGLGCETVQSSALLHDFALNSGKNVGACIALDIQALGGLRRTVEAGTAALQAMLPRANACRRSTQPLAKLTLAMNCGGSDANSGITANPALGIAVDELIRHGATAVLAETPEIYGAEHLLTRRAATREVGEELVAIVRWWEKYVQLHGASIDNNPTFGNKAGGLTTIYEKSLGAVAKAGQSPLMAVYAFAEKVTAQGLCFMDTPGFDPVSMTGLLAGACNLGVFTTGRGSVFGSKPAPCLKVASNTPLYQSMADDMDIDAGSILDDKETVGEVGRRIFDELVAIASGKKTKSEAQGVGDEEFAPWIIGPTL